VRGLGAIGAIAAKELVTILRDPVRVGTLVAQPALLVLVFGVIVRTDVRGAGWVVYDADQSELSRRLAEDVAATRELAEPLRVSSYAALDEAFRRSRGAAALVIPRGFAVELARRRAASVQLLLNGADPLVALRAAAVVGEVARRFAPEALAGREFAPFRPGAPPLVTLRRTVRWNPALADRWFFVPTIPAYFLTQLFFALACLSIVEERERGTYEHLLALPLRAHEVVLGKAVCFFALAAALVVAYFLIARFALGVPIRGSLGALALATLLFCADSYLAGMLLSVVARNSQQAIFLAVFTILPACHLSGFLVSTATMPAFLRGAALAFPMTHYVTALRCVVVRGAALGDIARPIAALAAIFVVLAALAGVLFPRRLW
jgi:ABC-2 type transport system permease protein